jgi:hypothetical protein
MYAAARANERRLAQQQEDALRLEQRLTRLQVDGAAAMSESRMIAEAELMAKRELVAGTQAQIERQQAQYEALQRESAETRVLATTLTDERPRLESLLALVRAYRSVERVELTLEALRGHGGDAEVATIADNIFQRFSEAQARIEMMRQAEDLEVLAQLEEAEVEDQLAERRHRLGLESEPGPVKPPATASAPATPEPGPTPEAPPAPGAPSPGQPDPAQP